MKPNERIEMLKREGRYKEASSCMDILKDVKEEIEKKLKYYSKRFTEYDKEAKKNNFRKIYCENKAIECMNICDVLKEILSELSSSSSADFSKEERHLNNAEGENHALRKIDEKGNRLSEGENPSAGTNSEICENCGKTREKHIASNDVRHTNVFWCYDLSETEDYNTYHAFTPKKGEEK